MATFKKTIDVKEFVEKLPKAELHIHIEGSLEPDMLFELAQKNKVSIPYKTVEDVQSAYVFTNLQTFLDIYYAGADVLKTEEDFYDLTNAYIQKCIADNVRHTEIFFDPQTHIPRGVPIRDVFSGIARALRDAKTSTGFSSYMIMCFLRHLTEISAIETLEAALPLREEFEDLWIGIGLDSSELNNPPDKFARVFDRCRELGFHLVAHAGEEGPPQFVTDCLDILHVERIDHGVRSEEDPELMNRLQQNKIPLTVCPLSNLKLKVVSDLKDHNLKRLLHSGLMVTVNSDDPAYFGGYVNQNYLDCAAALDLSVEDFIQIAKNSFLASFLPEIEKNRFLEEIDNYYKSLE